MTKIKECGERTCKATLRKQLGGTPRRFQWLNDGHAGAYDRDYSEATARQVDVVVHDMIDARSKTTRSSCQRE
ncbi:hypothetical protein ACXHXM_21810|uniref:hypothetical protein n=1 Tax=Rhizobium altiplani TaxID=1864509 RepID=UPI000A42712F|nr:hypothetical protein [Rhizobium altiplani]